MLFQKWKSFFAQKQTHSKFDKFHKIQEPVSELVNQINLYIKSKLIKLASKLLYCIVLYCIVLYCIVLYCILV